MGRLHEAQGCPRTPEFPRAAASPSALGPPFSGCHATISPPWSGSSVPTGQLADSAQPRPDRCGPGRGKKRKIKVSLQEDVINSQRQRLCRSPQSPACPTAQPHLLTKVISREAAAALMCRLGCRMELLQSRALAKVPTALRERWRSQEEKKA